MNNLSDKKILLVICGGISAYKSLDLIRLLKKQDAKIKTILTKSAKEFVTDLSVASLSQGKVYDDLFDAQFGLNSYTSFRQRYFSSTSYECKDVGTCCNTVKY